MTRAEGINIAPEKTYFSYLGQELTFTLYFPPISHLNPTSMDLIEKTDSEWKWYGMVLVYNRMNNEKTVMELKQAYIELQDLYDECRKSVFWELKAKPHYK